MPAGYDGSGSGTTHPFAPLRAFEKPYAAGGVKAYFYTADTIEFQAATNHLPHLSHLRLALSSPNSNSATSTL